MQDCRALNELSLPEVLNNHETVCTLSPDLLRKIEQVQCGGGLSIVDNSILKLEALSTACSIEQLKASIIFERFYFSQIYPQVQKMFDNEVLQTAGMACNQSVFSMKNACETRSALAEQVKSYERATRQCSDRYEALQCDWRNWKTEMVQLMTPIVRPPKPYLRESLLIFEAGRTQDLIQVASFRRLQRRCAVPCVRTWRLACAT
jgi:hypothetical protein